MFRHVARGAAVQGWKPDPALYTNEVYFRRLLEMLPAGAYTCNAEGLITYYNQHAEQLWGRKPTLNDPVDRFCGSFKLYAADGTPITHDQCWMALALNTEREYNGLEIIVERPDGQRRTVLAHASPIHNESGRLLGAVNVLVDITDRKRTELELQEKLRQLTLVHELSTKVTQARSIEEIYDTALDAILKAMHADRAAVLLFDADAVIRFRAWRGLSDAYRAAVEGHSPWRPDQADAAPVTVSDVGADGSLGHYRDIILREGIRALAFIPLTYENRLLGKFMVYANRPRVFLGPELQLAQTIANHVAFAIERKRSEQALLTSEGRLRAIMDASTAVIFVKDLEGRYTIVNPAWCELFGIPQAAGLGKTDVELFPEHVARTLWENDRRVIETKAPLCVEEVAEIDHRGRVVYISVKFPLRDAEGKIYGVGGISTDITELKRIQEALRESEERYRALTETLEQRVTERTRELGRVNEMLEQRNRELQDFAYAASHDLQEPLRKFRTFLGLLRQELDVPDEAVVDYITRMESSASRMSELITALLALSRVATRTERFQQTDLEQVIREVLSDLEVSTAEAGASIDLGMLRTIEADPLQMRQLFQNLIANALKFRRSDVRPAVRIWADGDGVMHAGRPACRVTVEDNGIGFEEKYADRIFAPFQRLNGRNQYPGTGMGLAICRRIAERHGGSITVRSTPGVGSAFTVTLPLQQRRG